MVIYAVPAESRAERDRVRRTLAWHGFGPLAAATWISPHPRLETVREALADLSATRIDLLESRSLSRAADREMAFGINDDPSGVRLADCVDAVVSHVEAAGADDVSLYDELPPNYQELFTHLAGASHDNTIALPLEVFQGAFMGDAEPAAAAVVHSVLRPQPFGTFTDPPVGGEAYRALGLPMHYVLSVGDVALPPGEYGWDRFAERIKTVPVSVPGSHESMFTRPGELADALVQVTAVP